MGKSPGDLQRFKDTLIDNLLDTQETLRETKLEDLEALRIPKVLAVKIVEKSKVLSKEGNANLSSQNVQNVEPVSKEKKAIHDLDEKLDRVFKEFISNEERTEALQMLSKILGNIHSAPNNEKFRKLNMNNGLLNITIFRHLEIFELLLMLGFQKTQDGYLVLQNYHEPLLVFTIHRVSEELAAASKRQTKFDPFKPSYSSNNPNFSVNMLQQVSDYSISSFDQKLKDLLEKRENLLRNHKVVPKIVKVTEDRKFEHADDNDEEPVINPSEEMKLFKQAVLDFQKVFLGQENFQSANKREFEKMAKEPLVLETTIRLKTIFGLFEVTFAANDTLKSLFEIVAKTFDLSVDKFCFSVFTKRYFYISPDSNKTFKDLNMIPNAAIELTNIS